MSRSDPLPRSLLAQSAMVRLGIALGAIVFLWLGILWAVLLP
ncbi:hypothetical protein [Aureimonas endophytica]|nr:hypothetical protein [Aureimonas endophytica]